MAASPPLPAVLASGKTWLVIDKPAGIAVHPGPRTPDSLEDLLPAFAQHGVVPQPVHRLDRDTSGCLVLARRPSAIRSLSRAFAGGMVDKTYLAIVQGELRGAEGHIDQPLLKRSDRRIGWRMLPDADGQPAQTDWRLLESRDGLSLIEFRPKTGRTHQIRVHMAAHRHPCVGDPLYGADPTLSARLGLIRQWLHAHELSFAHPVTTDWVTFRSEYPTDLAHALEVLRAS